MAKKKMHHSSESRARHERERIIILTIIITALNRLNDKFIDTDLPFFYLYMSDFSFYYNKVIFEVTKENYSSPKSYPSYYTIKIDKNQHFGVKELQEHIFNAVMK